jgi:acetolactate synthase-1/2/3 large subunit
VAGIVLQAPLFAYAVVQSRFREVSRSYGAVGIRVTKKSDVRAAIKRAIGIDNVVFLDFHVEPEENVYPMVPAGEALNRMIEGLA